MNLEEEKFTSSFISTLKIMEKNPKSLYDCGIMIVQYVKFLLHLFVWVYLCTAPLYYF